MTYFEADVPVLQEIVDEVEEGDTLLIVTCGAVAEFKTDRKIQ